MKLTSTPKQRKVVKRHGKAITVQVDKPKADMLNIPEWARSQALASTYRPQPGEVTPQEALAKIEETQLAVNERVAEALENLQVALPQVDLSEPVRTPLRLAQIAAILHMLEVILDDTEVRRQLLTKPLLAMKRQIDEKFREDFSFFAEAALRCRNLLVEHAAHEKSERWLAVQEQAQEARNEGHEQFAQDLLAVAQNHRVDTSMLPIAFQERAYAEITDLKAVCKAIADGKLPVSLVRSNTTTELTKWARTQLEKSREDRNVHGVQIGYSTTVTVHGAKGKR